MPYLRKKHSYKKVRKSLGKKKYSKKRHYKKVKLSKSRKSKKSKKSKSKKRKLKVRKQRGGLSLPFLPEIKNAADYVPFKFKAMHHNLNPPPVSTPANSSNSRNVNPLPYENQYDRVSGHIYKVPDVPQFWKISTSSTNNI
tara:strand:+ start:385 stop:807 length:423 start_codon:yes stop_codon:yes gene_type:complete